MGNRLGGVAGAVALGAALVLALGVAITGSGIDYASGTYTFTEPSTDYVDESTVLVQDGSVTGVWISDADRVNEYYGYTPHTPADMFYEGNNTEVESRSADEITFCDHFEEGGQSCGTFHDLERSSAGRARAMSAWSGLTDGRYRFDTRSVTWELGSTHMVEIDDGVVQNAPSPEVDLPAIDTNQWGVPGSDWVLYWVNDAAEPFAACYDEPNTYDEEWCVVWSPA